MDGDVLNRRSFSLVELSLVLMSLSVILAVSFYSTAKVRQVIKAQRTLDELNAVAIVSTRYYLENSGWPTSLSSLRPKYLGPNSTDFNPFGNPYWITGGISSVSVSTILPKGLVSQKSFGSEVVIVNQGTNDMVTVTRSLESNNWKLRYEKKYIYKE
ncbi:MAG: type II secretion system protein [Candidatus Omnitrophica bacterium]|jgi:competence protein ComGC|nr:type II secretion system protein [Candidatus Omnitrophota bacterium]